MNEDSIKAFADHLKGVSDEELAHSDTVFYPKHLKDIDRGVFPTFTSIERDASILQHQMVKEEIAARRHSNN